ncbi:hypothetical protein [Streptococcus zalophi]|uniref:hypothetical protein n=1 Tax=Streptococcus zalophi TaxID=640031 RepID=UPI00215D01FE|nr:hypothetical protein [Streptococcus zalophi]MCR8967198.1 hypothetical protein [Streptococcus zalophi]
MIKIFKPIIEAIRDFIDPKEKPSLEDITKKQLLDVIKQALDNDSSVHVIYQDKSFTGDIVRFEENSEKLIMKNFQRNLSAIIAISDIHKISIVPPSIKVSQNQLKDY